VQVDRNGPTLTEKAEKALKAPCYGKSYKSISADAA
jgi:hypothetical protein